MGMGEWLLDGWSIYYIGWGLGTRLLRLVSCACATAKENTLWIEDRVVGAFVPATWLRAALQLQLNFLVGAVLQSCSSAALQVLHHVWGSSKNKLTKASRPQPFSHSPLPDWSSCPI